jgi:lipopolysaccharide export system protein LptC
MTDDGSALQVTAATARPAVAGGRGASAEAIRAVLEAPDGGRTEIAADHGEIDPAGEVLTMAGAVRLLMADGWEITTGALTARLDRTEVETPGAIAARGGFGTLTAGAMRLTTAAGRPESHVLLFTGGVRLVYRPRGTQVD